MRWLAIVVVAAFPLHSQAPLHTLMPVPASVRLANGTLPLDSSFRVGIAGYRDGRLERGVQRAIARLEMRLGVPLSRNVATIAASAPSNPGPTLIVHVDGPGFAVPDLAEDESYQLKVSETRAELHARTVVGALRGLETLLQLQTTASDGLAFQTAEIEDHPRFRWRGLLLDVSRHFEPVDVIQRTLDGMAMVKLNVFHWHLSDDQGFRVESRVFPRLQQFGSDSLFYTQDEIRAVVAYAADRGIRVVPEFDVPGHATSWFVGYPELASAAGPFEIQRTWGVFPGVMDPTRESTYQFLDRFIGEMAALFPDPYWHVGGDEVDSTEWHANPAVLSWREQHGNLTPAGLHTQFNRRLFDIVQRHGKHPVGWDEIFQPDLPTSAVIQSWRSTTALANAARAGFRGILSAPYYIDHQKPTADFYLPDPLPSSTDLTPEQQDRVLGGEACMWGEYINASTVDSRIWPRLAAIAERFWSPRDVNDVADMYRRLTVTSHRLTELGLHHEDQPRRLMRQIAGDSAPMLEEFLGYVRPRDFGGTGSNQWYPHTRIIDAAIADPEPGRRLSDLLRRAMRSDAAASDTADLTLQRIERFTDRLRRLVPESPRLADGLPISMVLSYQAHVGRQALQLVRSGSAPPAGWAEHADSMLNASQSSRGFGDLRPAFTDALRALVQSARGLSSRGLLP